MASIIMICAHSLSVGIGCGGVGGAVYVNSVLAAFVPPGVVTRTLAVPAVPAGVEQVILVALTTLTLVQALPPTDTAVAPVKLAPAIVIDVPPAVLPEVGVTELTVGAGVTYVNSVLAAFVCPPTVTSTLAVPAFPGGVVQVSEVEETTTTDVHALAPTFTVAEFAKLVPVMVIDVPPAVLPEVGVTDVMAGAELTVSVKPRLSCS
jgi:hypothetical protein